MIETYKAYDNWSRQGKKVKLEMVRRLRRRGFDPKPVGADKAYGLGDFPRRLTDLRIKPHLAVNVHRPPGSPARRHARGLG